MRSAIRSRRAAGPRRGQALYAWPTRHIQFTGQTTLAAAFSSRAAGGATGESYSLALTDFPRYRANLKLEFEC
ncbi:MAG: hypothetical protein ABR929_05900 [Roseiarcus sp.]|jgi:hypothetical protein